MALANKRAALRRSVRRLAESRTLLLGELEKTERALADSMRSAYLGGVTAIKLSELTGIPRQNVYDWIRRPGDGEIELQQPRKKNNDEEGVTDDV